MTEVSLGLSSAKLRVRAPAISPEGAVELSPEPALSEVEGASAGGVLSDGETRGRQPEQGDRRAIEESSICNLFDHDPQIPQLCLADRGRRVYH